MFSEAFHSDETKKLASKFKQKREREKVENRSYTRRPTEPHNTFEKLKLELTKLHLVVKNVLRIQTNVTR